MNVRRVVFFLSLLFCFGSYADNPIFQTLFTADPAPMVYKDTLFCYTSHDEDVLVNNFFTMRDWLCYSTTDMVNWQARGRVASLKDFKWTGNNGAWAVQCVERDGKFYMYCPIHMKGTGVLVADNPAGPFTDPLGKALLTDGGNDIDPTAFVDTDGQAYLYFGNPECRYVKLNEDMISYSGGVKKLSMTVAAFGTRSKNDRATSYEEGPWFYRRGELYYLVFAGGPISEHIAYSTSSGPTGPWKYRGKIMPTQSGAAFTNHPGVVDFKDNSYLFYHDQALSRNGFKRSVCVEKFSYNSDGTIPTIRATKAGAPQIGAFDPYTTIQAETMCLAKGVEIGACSEGGVMVDSINNNDYIKVKGVEFRDGAKSFEARVASDGSGGKIELRLDSENGKLVGTCDVSGTGGWQMWTTVTCNVSDASGKHDLYLKFTGGNGFLFNFNWWKFVPITNGTDVPRENCVPAIAGLNVLKGAAALQMDVSRYGTGKKVSVQLFGINGRLAGTLFEGKTTSGKLLIPLDRRQYKAGGYVVRLCLQNETVLHKVITLE